MSRSGYSDDWDGDGLPPDFYRRSVDNAIAGKRGQAFLREMLAALDALPAPRLISDELQDVDGEVCAIGSVGRSRGLDMSKLDVGDPWAVADAFGIARALASEIVFENDEDFSGGDRTPEERFQRMRRWVVENIKGTSNV